MSNEAWVLLGGCVFLLGLLWRVTQENAKQVIDLSKKGIR